MRARARRLIVGCFLCCAWSWAQQPEPGAAPGAAGQEEHAPNRVWNWINFGLLAAGLSVLIVRNGPAFFNARSRDIQKAIQDATGLKIQADFRASESDRKMATLPGEVERLRREAREAGERERERIHEETGAALARLEDRTTRELQALEHVAQAQLRRYTVQLAASLAASRLRDRLSAADQHELVRDFAASLANGDRRPPHPHHGYENRA